MKLWILKAKKPVGYDSYNSFVVRAESEKNARKLAAESKGDENYISRPVSFWESPDFSSCEELTALGPEEIVVGSFNAG